MRQPTLTLTEWLIYPLYFRLGGYMSKILDWLFGIDIISVDDAISIFQQAIKTVDTDNNGYLNIRELITIFKRMCKNDGNGHKNG